MSDDGRRLGIRTRLGTGAANPAGRVGEPNVLSDAATPNRLSSEVARPVNVSTLAQAPTARLAAPGAARPATRPLSLDPQPTGRRAPTLQTLIVIGFLVFTAVRLAGQFLGNSGSGAPLATTPGGPQAAVPGPGSVLFGTGLTDFCGVSNAAGTFPSGTDVWWSAEMSTVQEPGVNVVVIVRRDGAEVDREKISGEASSGKWLVTCASKPIGAAAGSHFRVEVWDAGVTALLASGEFVVSPG